TRQPPNRPTAPSGATGSSSRRHALRRGRGTPRQGSARRSPRRSGSPETSCGQQLDGFIDLGALQVVEEGGGADADRERHSLPAVPVSNDLLQRIPQELGLAEPMPGGQ